VILFHLLYPGLPWPTRWTLPVGGRASALREVDTVLKDIVGWHVWW